MGLGRATPGDLLEGLALMVSAGLAVSVAIAPGFAQSPGCG